MNHPAPVRPAMRNVRNPELARQPWYNLTVPERWLSARDPFERLVCWVVNKLLCWQHGHIHQSVTVQHAPMPWDPYNGTSAVYSRCWRCGKRGVPWEPNRPELHTQARYDVHPDTLEELD